MEKRNTMEQTTKSPGTKKEMESSGAYAEITPAIFKLPNKLLGVPL